MLIITGLTIFLCTVFKNIFILSIFQYRKRILRMFRVLPLIILLLGFNTLKSQSSYFQQEVNFTIKVSLDDEKHILMGEERIEYINKSPQSLTYIYFHLWYNAFNTHTSAYAKQELRNGKTAYHFAQDNQKGFITGFDFKVNGKKCEVEIDKDNPDIAKLILPEPLAPQNKIIITTPFTAKIPHPFSRAGHIGQQYLITQWFPKPAVFDTEGWHPMPYLDQGEFYSEFGKYDVSITLPDNYVVGATGSLMTDSEKVFLEKKSQESVSDIVPESSKTSKTLQYVAENVHDFAWFADKAFQVAKSSVVLKSGKIVDTYAFYRAKHAQDWSKATEYINRAVRFYSDLVGEYPHPHASAVMADEGYGGGMEYPMITVLAGNFGVEDLDGTITHEIGHNWFQGILGSNERDFAWLDEGLNSYYDHRYLSTYYPHYKMNWGLLSRLFKNTDYSSEDLYLHRQDFNHKHQAIQLTSDSLTETNYYINAYEKPARLMKVLERHYGTSRFDSIMQAYYQVWKFKHPQPQDLKKHWETATSDNLSWLFDDLFKTTGRTDYAVTDVKATDSDWLISVKNKGQIASPFEITGLKANKEVFKQSFQGIAQEGILKIKKESFDLIALDNDRLLTDIDRTNNYQYLKGDKKVNRPLRAVFLGGIDDSKKRVFNYLPLLVANNYDGLMLGGVLYNGVLPEKKLNWHVAPLYATDSKKLVGVANIDYGFYKNNNKVTLSLSGKRFSYKKTPTKNTLSFSRLTPSVTIDFWRRPMSTFVQSLSIRHSFIGEDNVINDSIERISIRSQTANNSEISYSGKIQNVLSPTSFRLCVESYKYHLFNRRQNFIKATFELNQVFTYKENRKIFSRLFIGGFPFNSGRNSGLAFTRGFLGLSARGFADYRYDDYYFGRNELKGILSQQITTNTEGGLKYALPQNDETRIGYSNNFVAALNFKAQFPFKLPLDIKPYFDIGFFSDTRPNGERTNSQWLMSGGLSWEVNEYFGIYVPLYFSGNSEDPNSFKSIMTRRGGFLSRVTFNLNLRKLDLLHIIKSL